jgi:fructosamine-3-kinase
MINNKDWQQICNQIEQAIKRPFSITNIHPVSGGCINTAYILQGVYNSFFIKLNRQQRLPMFKAEFAGLKEMLQTKTVRVPQPITTGVFAETSFLVLEMITLKPGNHQSDQQLGHQLAAIHQIQQDYFGWHQNNTIGSTEQINKSSKDWIPFWRENRLGFQLKLANSKDYGNKLKKSGEKLSESLNSFFFGYQPQPSLLHGDLWGGNAAITEHNEPIIYDPACYYGDRETDIAMTELFGGFSANFYAAYNESYPLHTDYNIRKTLYNLYHILNHLNLFGEGYLHQAQHMIDSLLTEIKS